VAYFFGPPCKYFRQAQRRYVSVILENKRSSHSPAFYMYMSVGFSLQISNNKMLCTMCTSRMIGLYITKLQIGENKLKIFYFVRSQ